MMCFDLASWTQPELLRRLAEIETELHLLASSKTDTALRLAALDKALRAELGRRRQELIRPAPVRGLPAPRQPRLGSPSGRRPEA